MSNLVALDAADAYQRGSIGEFVGSSLEGKTNFLTSKNANFRSNFGFCQMYISSKICQKSYDNDVVSSSRFF